jgi:hypothetical protein
LRIDARVALTFSGIALSTSDLGKREHTIKFARRAYDTILSLKAGVRLTQVNGELLARDLRRLKIELEVLGETLVDNSGFRTGPSVPQM